MLFRSPQITAITSWREFDDAVAEAGAEVGHGHHSHSSLVFRGLARAS